ncbi:MAG TPA: hypothetical protein VF584_02480 [Longimicrobium sp.]|jgi:hypothetical protein
MTSAEYLSAEAQRFVLAGRQIIGETSLLDVRALAVRVADQWRNALTHVKLVERTPIPLEHIAPEIRTERVLARRWFVSAEELPELLVGVARGKLFAGEDEILYLRSDGRDGEVPYADFWTFDNPATNRPWIQPSWVPANSSRWPALVYTARGDSLSATLAPTEWREGELDTHLHTARVPFDGYNGVAEGIVGLRRGARGDHATEFHLRLPVSVQFDTRRSRLDNGRLTIQLDAHTPQALRQTELGIAAFAGGDLVRAESILVKDALLDPGAEISPALIIIEDLAAERVVLTLRIRGLRVDGLTLEDPSFRQRNPRVRTYASVDDGMRHLHALLNPSSATKETTHGFERAVARLFYLLGFQALQMGPEGKLSNSLDVFAFDPYSERAYAIECTLGSIGSGGKLGKLVQRAREMESLIDRVVEPVLVTSAPRSELSLAELRDAARDQISVVAQEELTALMQLASADSPTRDVAAAITEWIPRIPTDRGIGVPGPLGALMR